MNKEMHRALDSLLSHFNGTYNNHRYKNRGMPLRNAIDFVESELAIDKIIVECLEELEVARNKRINDAINSWTSSG